VLGEKACLFVTLKPGATLTLGEVTGWLGAAQVSKVKWPERLEIVDAMPLTPTRKIMKGQLAKRLRV
jgi:non-ribosomal peptide synthetase component E (peptide arylation enzyme)